MKYKVLINVTLVLFVASFLSCSSSRLITSNFNEGKIQVDGIQDEWGKSISFLNDEKLSFGVENDNDYLYIVLTTSDRANIMKILNMGLTLWLEPKQDGKILGIRYPQKPDPESRPSLREFKMGEEKEDERLLTMINAQDEFSIVNEDNYSLYAFNVNVSKDFKVKLGYSMGQLVYELQIPISDNSQSPMILNTYPGGELDIVVKSDDIERPSVGNRAKGNRQPGMGEGTGGGRMPGGGMGQGQRPRQGGNMGDIMKPLDFSVTVKLAGNN